MIPIKDHSRTETFPFITYLIMGANIGLFVYMYLILLPQGGGAYELFIDRFALFPARVVAGRDLIGLVTSVFLHGGLGHIISNMLFLNIFGDNLEDRFGHFGYLFFYLVCGLGASALQILVDPGSNIPNLGASGAIAGLMGGYLVLFPKNKIDVLFSWGWTYRRSTVPAYFMLFYWFAFQLLFGAGSLSSMGEGGVAYFAHVGGFATGWLLTRLKRS